MKRLYPHFFAMAFIACCFCFDQLIYVQGYHISICCLANNWIISRQDNWRSSVAEWSKVLYTGSRGQGFEFRHCWVLLMYRNRAVDRSTSGPKSVLRFCTGKGSGFPVWNWVSTALVPRICKKTLKS